MVVPWLLIVVLGLTAKEVFCRSVTDFGDPPPRPKQGTF